jgi:hypothetical protein
MSTLRASALAAALMAGVSTPSVAALVDLTGDIVSSGPITVVYVFQDALDTSTLAWSQAGSAFAQLIQNNGPGATAIGTTIVFGGAGPVTFRLNNITQGYSFDTGVRDPVDRRFHARVTQNFADFRVGALPADAAAAIALQPPGPFVFVGFEDRRNGDYDFNDLIYYFRPVIAEVPAPAGLALFGAGLLGLAAFGRRRA